MTSARFLLDQMLDADVADALNQQGFSAVRVAALGMTRSADDKILTAAIAAGQTLITLDEHFGDWAVLPLMRTWRSPVWRSKADTTTLLCKKLNRRLKNI